MLESSFNILESSLNNYITNSYFESSLSNYITNSDLEYL